MSMKSRSKWLRAQEIKKELAIGLSLIRERHWALGLIYGRPMASKARTWASGNKTTPCKANSRQQSIMR
jgi:hypothetical protein